MVVLVPEQCEVIRNFTLKQKIKSQFQALKFCLLDNSLLILVYINIYTLYLLNILISLFIIIIYIISIYFKSLGIGVHNMVTSL